MSVHDSSMGVGVGGGSVHMLYPGLSRVLPLRACVYLQSSKHRERQRIFLVSECVCVLAP